MMNMWKVYDGNYDDRHVKFGPEKLTETIGSDKLEKRKTCE